MTDIIDRLTFAQIGSCSCGTKTNEHMRHDPYCPYRAAEDAKAEIERLRANQDRLVSLINGGYKAAARSMRERAIAECQNYVGIDKAIKFQLKLTADMIAALPLIEKDKT